MTKKYNYKALLSPYATRTKRVDTSDDRWNHFSIEGIDLMHDQSGGELFVKTSKLAFHISFVTCGVLMQYLDKGWLTGARIKEHLQYPARVGYTFSPQYLAAVQEIL